jgi:hypothetical protein
MKADRLKYWLNLVVILSILWVAWPTSLQSAATTPVPTPISTRLISLSPTSGTVGQTIYISGLDFSDNGSISTILLGSVNVTQYKDEITNGEFDTSFVVPTLPKAAYTLTVTSDAGDSASATFTILPKIALAEASGRVSDQIVVNGDGLPASSKISVYWDYSTTALTTGAATASGLISGLAGSVPETSAGSHVVRIVDSSGNSVSINYTVNPIITIDPVTVLPGAETNISGSGFAPSSQVSVDLDNRLITNYVNTDIKGTLLKTKIVIPSVSAGTHIITVTDKDHNYAKYTVNASCSIAVNPKSGLIGSLVTITGSGFLPSKSISFDYNGKNLTAGTQPRSDGEGSFRSTFNVPNSPAGTYTITATDGINSSSAIYMAASSSGLEVNTGIVGAIIPVSGIGFTAGATVNIKFDGAGIAKTSVDAAGTFSTTFQVPARGGGLHKIILTDGINPVSYNFTILPTAQISNSGGSGTQINGYLGSPITVSGNAFTPAAQVSVLYDSREVATPIANTDGSFSVNFEAPVSRPGKHIITASEGPNQFTFTFMMEATPPAVPMPISPIKDARNEGLPKFQWSSVTDPSGVTYMLQVASEPSFSAPLIQKNDLTSAAIQLAEGELLVASKKNQPYYWRVKAVDGVLNESQWSPAYTFSVGRVLPAWIWYGTGAAAVIIILIAGYFVGKKWPDIIPGFLGLVKSIRVPIPKFKKKE